MNHDLERNRNERTALLYRFLLSFLLFATGATVALAASGDERPGLQVIALSEESDPALLGGKPYTVLQLSNADLPALISQSLVPSLVKRPLIRFSDFGLLEQGTFLDAHTCWGAQKKGEFWWKNKVAKLRLQIRGLVRNEKTYFLDSRSFGPGSFSLNLKGAYKRKQIREMKIKGRIDRTTVAIQPVANGTSLFIAFTWTDAIFEAVQDGEAPEDADIQYPKPVHRTAPTSPAEFVDARIYSKAWVLVRINAQGRADPSEFVILECAHPLIAKNLMKEVLKNWRFAPASVNGKPQAGWAYVLWEP